MPHRSEPPDLGLLTNQPAPAPHPLGSTRGVILLAPPYSLVPPAPPWSVVAPPLPQTSGIFTAFASLQPYGSGLSGFSFSQATPHSSLAPSSPQASGILAPPLSLVSESLPWCPGPLVSLSLSVHWTSPELHHFLALPQSVGLKFPPWLLPPSV